MVKFALSYKYNSLIRFLIKKKICRNRRKKSEKHIHIDTFFQETFFIHVVQTGWKTFISPKGLGCLMPSKFDSPVFKVM